jgi:toxin YhaV
MAMSRSETLLIVKGWKIGAHPFFVDQLVRLIEAGEQEEAERQRDHRDGANAKLLAAILKLTLDVIPNDPTAPAFRQGDTLGSDRKHWFRAKFGGGRFRLFFRYSSSARTILYAWVNDENTLRTYGSKTDAYKVFKKMLDTGNPRDDWDSLFAAASKSDAARRLSNILERGKKI